MKRGMLSVMVLVIALFTQPLYATVQFYKVTHILDNDTLNVRTGPGTESPILIALPYNTKNIEIIEKQADTSWVKITVPGTRKLGWVNKHYLKKYDEVPPKGYKCLGTEPFWNIQVADSSVEVSALGGDKFSVPLTLNTHAMNAPPESRIITASNAEHAVSAFIREGSCSDGMSDNMFDYHIMTLVDNKAYTGCCNAIK